MASLKQRVTSKVHELRTEHPRLDHAVRTQEHYGDVKASQWAGAVTYFGFLSVFPILALAFFFVGYLSRVFPDAQDTLVEAIDSMLPGIVGNGDEQLSLSEIEDAANTVGLIGLVGVLYTGLGWLSALRDALITVFALPDREQPSFVMGKVRDLITLAVLGTVLLVAVALTGVVAGFAEDLLDWANLSEASTWMVKLVTIAVGLVANSILVLLMFRLLAAPGLPWRAMASGALLGAVGFEILKQLSTLLISLTQEAPAFQVFGITLILLVWINYASRLILYAAAWAWTHPLAEAQRVAAPAAPVEGPPLPSIDELPAAGEEDSKSRKGAFAAGAVAGATAAAVIKGRSSGDNGS
jgi:membrane protein